MATTALTLNASSNPKSEAQSALGPSKASLTTAASAADDFGTALDELLDQLRSKVAAVSEEMLAKSEFLFYTRFYTTSFPRGTAMEMEMDLANCESTV